MTPEEAKKMLLKKLVGGLVNATPGNVGMAALKAMPKVTYAVGRTANDIVKNVPPPKPAVIAPGTNLPAPTPLGIAKGIAEAGQAGVKGFVEGTGNTLGALANLGSYVSPTYPRWLSPEVQEEYNKSLPGNIFMEGGKALSNVVSQGQSNLNREGVAGAALNPNSGASAVGGFLGNVAAQVPSMVLGGNVTDKITNANVFKNMPFLGRLMGNVTGGAVGTEGMSAANEGRFSTPEELLSGGLLDAAATIVSGGLNKFSKNAYDRILGLTPKQQGEMADRGLDLAGEMSKKGYVSTSKKGLAQKFGKDIGNLSDQLDDLIRKADMGDEKAIIQLGTKAGVTGDDLIKDLKSRVLSDKRLRPKFGEMKTVEKQIDLALSEFKSTIGNKTLSFEQVQNLKKKLGGSLTDLLAKSGDAKGTAKELVNDVIRDNAKTLIETNVKGAGRLNKQMAPLIEIKDQLKKKGDYSGYLMDSLLGGATAAGGISSGKSPQEIMQDVLFNLALKRFAGSTTGRSLRGSALGNLSKYTNSSLTRQAMKNLTPSFIGK